jgi:predicted cation transporter
MILVFGQDCVRVLCKKHHFLLMDMLITAVAIALICVAAWMLYKRFSLRFKAQPEEPVEEDYEEEVQEATADPEPITRALSPEPKKEA